MPYELLYDNPSDDSIGDYNIGLAVYYNTQNGPWLDDMPASGVSSPGTYTWQLPNYDVLTITNTDTGSADNIICTHEIQSTKGYILISQIPQTVPYATIDEDENITRYDAGAVFSIYDISTESMIFSANVTLGNGDWLGESSVGVGIIDGVDNFGSLDDYGAFTFWNYVDEVAEPITYYIPNSILSVTPASQAASIKLVQNPAGAIDNNILAGGLKFSDTDLSSVPTVVLAYQSVSVTDADGNLVSITPEEIAAVNAAFKITVADNVNSGEIDWAYNPDGTALTFLVGETAVEAATIDITDQDGNGATAEVTITIVGLPADALFTTAADAVDFNNLTQAQQAAIQHAAASIYDGLGGDDVVILPSAANFNESIGDDDTLNWSSTTPFQTGSQAGDTYTVIGSDGDYNIQLGAGSDTVTINGNGSSTVIGGTGVDSVTFGGTGTDTFAFDDAFSSVTLATPSQTNAVFGNFQPGDTIDLKGAAANEDYFNPDDDILTVYNAQYGQSPISTVTKISFTGGNFQNYDFDLSPDGQGGTKIMLGDPPPTLKQLADLADAAYEPTASVDNVFKLQPLYTNSDNGFLAVVYAELLNNVPDQIVISFRGTNPKLDWSLAKNLIADASFLTTFPNFNLYNYVLDAGEVLSKVRSAFPDANITLTGHSLGGAIAAIVAKASSYPAATFDAPGASQLYSKLLPVLKPSFSANSELPASQVLPSNSQLPSSDTAYRLEGDQVSLVGSQIGSVYTLANPASVGPINALYNHSMDSFVSTLAAGEPISAGIPSSDLLSAIVLPVASKVIGKELDAVFAELNVVALALDLLPLDPVGGDRYEMTETPGSALFHSIELPSVPGVASYDVSVETVDGVWSADEVVSPGEVYTPGAGFEAFKFLPLNASNQPFNPGYNLTFGVSFATAGTFSGTLSVDDALSQFTASEVTAQFNPDGSISVVTPDGDETLTNTTSVSLADATLDIGGNAISELNATGGLVYRKQYDSNYHLTSLTYPSETPTALTAPTRSDLLFRSLSGDLATWQVDDAAVTGGGAIGNPGLKWTYEGSGDFYGNGDGGLLFQNQDDELAIWEVAGTQIVGGGAIGSPGGTWQVVGVGDFNGDGASDILFQDAGGDLATWELNGTTIVGGAALGNAGPGWTLLGLGDFNADGTSGLLFRNASGQYATWEVRDDAIVGGALLGQPGADWVEKGVGNFNGLGAGDILFENVVTGVYATWDVSDDAVSGGGSLGNPGPDWAFSSIDNLTANGRSSVVFHNVVTGQYATWDLDDATIAGGGILGNPGPDWALAKAPTPATAATLVFADTSGDLATWTIAGDAITGGGALGNPGPGWTALAVGDFWGEGQADVLFQYTNGEYALWRTDGSQIVGGGAIGSAPGYTFLGLGDFNGDGTSDLLFEDKTTGDYATWTMHGAQILGGADWGTEPGLTFVATGDFNGDGTSDVLFVDASGNYYVGLVGDDTLSAPVEVGNVSNLSFIGVGDFNGDGKADVLFGSKGSLGNYWIWEMNGTSVVGGGDLGQPSPGWTYAGVAAIDASGRNSIVFQQSGTGLMATWETDGMNRIGGATLGYAPGYSLLGAGPSAS